MGDLGERQAAPADRQALELGGAELGDDHVDLVARRRDHRAGLEPGAHLELGGAEQPA